MKCRICGCTDDRACVVRVQGRDGAVYESPCAWFRPGVGGAGVGICTGCWPAALNPKPIVPPYLSELAEERTT